MQMLYKIGPMAKTFFDYARKTAIVSSIIDRPTINKELSKLKNAGATYKHLEKCRDIIERKKINDLPRLIDALVKLLQEAPGITPEQLSISMESIRKFQNNNLEDEVPLLVNSLAKIINTQKVNSNELASFTQTVLTVVLGNKPLYQIGDKAPDLSGIFKYLTESFLKMAYFNYGLDDEQFDETTAWKMDCTLFDLEGNEQ